MKALQELAPEQAAGGGGGRGGRGGFGAAAEPAGPGNLATIGQQLVAAVMPMQGSEMPPTAGELKAFHAAQASYVAVMAKWSAIKTPKAAAKK